MAKVIRYMISVTPNYGKRRILAKEYKTKREAQAYIKRLNEPAKFRVVNGRKIYLTRYRDALSGFGINNPRIIKRLVNR